MARGQPPAQPDPGSAPSGPAPGGTAEAGASAAAGQQYTDPLALIISARQTAAPEAMQRVSAFAQQRNVQALDVHARNLDLAVWQAHFEQGAAMAGLKEPMDLLIALRSVMTPATRTFCDQTCPPLLPRPLHLCTISEVLGALRQVISPNDNPVAAAARAYKELTQGSQPLEQHYQNFCSVAAQYAAVLGQPLGDERMALDFVASLAPDVREALANYHFAALSEAHSKALEMIRLHGMVSPAGSSQLSSRAPARYRHGQSPFKRPGPTAALGLPNAAPLKAQRTEAQPRQFLQRAPSQAPFQARGRGLRRPSRGLRNPPAAPAPQEQDPRREAALQFAMKFGNDRQKAAQLLENHQCFICEAHDHGVPDCPRNPRKQGR